MNKELIDLADKLIVELMKNKDQKSLMLFQLFLAEMSKSLNTLKNK